MRSAAEASDLEGITAVARVVISQSALGFWTAPDSARTRVDDKNGTLCHVSDLSIFRLKEKPDGYQSKDR